MNTQIMTSCRYGCLAVLAGLLVTGMPGDGRAIDSGLFNQGSDSNSCENLSGKRCRTPGTPNSCTQGKNRVCPMICTQNRRWSISGPCTRTNFSSNGAASNARSGDATQAF